LNEYLKICMCIFIHRDTFNLTLLIVELIVRTTVSKLLSETCLIMHKILLLVYTSKIFNNQTSGINWSY
jgi:hypothetical protein